ncbi:FkbM family methyltransferase [Candidatus Dependentiae bacterium]
MKINKIILSLSASFLIMGHSCSFSKYSYFSQYKQDKYIHENFFGHKKNGTFVEIGASDGIKISNTLFFEQYLEWDGICVEPMPHFFKQLEKNRSCICIEGCIADFNGTAKFLQVHGYANMLSGLANYYDPRHIQRIESEIRSHGGKKEFTEVQCYTLESILNKYNISSIDFLSIDTEGNEYSILKSIDFDKIFIDVICVENNYNTKNIKLLLEKKGYKFITKIGSDEIYKKLS